MPTAAPDWATDTKSAPDWARSTPDWAVDKADEIAAANAKLVPYATPPKTPTSSEELGAANYAGNVKTFGQGYNIPPSESIHAVLMNAIGREVESAKLTPDEVKVLASQPLAKVLSPVGSALARKYPKVASVMERAGANIAGGLENPENLLAAPLGGEGASFLAKPVSALFAAYGAYLTGEGIKHKSAEEIVTGVAATALPAMGLIAKGEISPAAEKLAPATAAAVKETVTGKDLKTPEGAKPTPEKITAAAVKDANGQPQYGANHPEVEKKLGMPETTSEQRNTPQYGFKTDKRDFITREEAGPVATASGQNLKEFEPGEPVHSNEVAAKPGGETPLSESKVLPKGIDYAAKRTPEQSGVPVGMKLSQDDLPELIFQVEKAKADASKAIQSDDQKGFQEAYGRGVYLGEVKEGINRKGPNYDLYSKRSASKTQPTPIKEPPPAGTAQKTAPAAAEIKSPIETLNTAPKVTIKAPKGATMVRVTDSAGRTAIQDIKSVQGDNVFKDAGIKKIEAGTIGKDKKFIPIKGEVEVEPKLVGMGGALEGEVATGAGADITGIAQRVREQVAKAGQEGLPPRGEGINAEDSVERGEEMLKQGADPEKAMADFEASPEKRFGASDMALVRAQLRRLAFEARRTEEQHGTESPEFLKAWQARTDWAARVKKMQTQWHAAGEAQQGEQDIDTGSFSGLATAFKDDTGRDFTEPQRKAAKRIAAGVNEADKAAAKAAADLNQHLFDFLKDVPVKVPDTVGQAQRVFAEFSKGHRLANIIGPMSQHQIKFIWGFAKKYYTDRGETNFEKIFQGVANDLGLDVKDVRRALARNSNGQKILHDAYVKQYRARQLKNSAKLWVKSQADPTWWRRIKSIPRAQFNLTVTGHATTWIGTHAGQNLFDPTRWGTLGRNYHKMWRVAFSEANWEAEAADLTKRPNWGIARRAGVNNDPYVRQGDYDSPEMTKFFAKLGAGKKGALGLLTLRQDFFDQAWDKLPQSNRTDEAAKLIANDVNHSTGTTRMQAVERPLTSFLMFAPRLVAARWQWELYDPAKAIITKAFKNSTATPAEHMFANMILKRRAIFAATYISALGLNSILLDATGSNQKLNLTDPHKSDWLGFKGFGMEARPFSAGIAIMRLLAAEYKDLFITPQKPKPWEEPRAQSAGDITQYLQQTASPTASTLADLISQTDMFGNPLPPQPGRDIKNPPPKQPKWQEREGRAPYTWPSYAAQRFSPIPFEAAIREAFQSQGMPADKAANWTRIILGSAAMATTGVLVEKDPNLNK